MSKASLRKTPLTLLTPKIGHVHAVLDSCVVVDATGAHIVKLSSCTPSSTSESDRLKSKIASKIQRRLDQQKGIHQIDRDLGEYMRVLRGNMGVTCAQVADHLGLPFIQMYMIEQGTRSATIENLYKIFKFYGLPITEIIIHAKTT